MVSIAETNSYDKSIIALWQEAFGDTEEDIQFFIDDCKNKSVLTLYDDNELCAMLFLVDADVNGNKYKYIYAACTFKKFRGKGYMTELLSYAVNAYHNVLLIPADSKLVTYYRKRNFDKIIEIDNIKFNECSEIKEYLFEGCSLDKPFALAFIKGE